MTIANQLKTRRTALGLTQEQIATRLHVSTPAVNKWEKGHSTPDVALLPALARLLEIDMNTLFDFNETLSEAEITLVIEELSELVLAGDIDDAFTRAAVMLRDYPNSLALRYQLALNLHASLILKPEWTTDEKAPYQARVTDWLCQVADGDDAELANAARHMLALDFLDRGELDHAEAMIDALPKAPYDRYILQGELLYRRGDVEAAATHISAGIFETLTKAVSQLYKMIDLEVKMANNDAAHALADATAALVGAFRLWPAYGTIVPQLVVALREENVSDSLHLLRAALEATHAPYEPPLLTHFPRMALHEDLADTYRQSLIQEARTSADYNFLRDSPDFDALLAEFE